MGNTMSGNVPDNRLIGSIIFSKNYELPLRHVYAHDNNHTIPSSLAG